MVTAIQSIGRENALPCTELAERLTISRFEIIDSSCPFVALTLPFAEQVRRALIRNRVDTYHSEAITGKRKKTALARDIDHRCRRPLTDMIQFCRRAIWKQK